MSEMPRRQRPIMATRLDTRQWRDGALPLAAVGGVQKRSHHQGPREGPDADALDRIERGRVIIGVEGV